MSKEKKALKPVVRVTSYILILLPAVLSFAYVYSFGVNIPFGDMWRMVPIFDQFWSGTLSVSDLFRWSQHYEHRLFFPGIAMLLLGIATKFNIMAIVYFIQFCLVGVLAIFLLAFRDTVGSKIFLFVPVSFLVFSLGQYWDTLQAFSINLVFAQFFGLFAFYLLYVSGYKRSKNFAFLGALGSATVAAFSSVNGLLVWPVGALQLLITPVERSLKKFLIGVWSLTGVGVWAFYFLSRAERQKPGNQQSFLYAFEHPTVGIDYFLSLLGSSLFRSQSLAFASGLLLLGLIAAGLLLIYKDRKWGEHSFWIALLLFSCGTLASITVGRAGFEEAVHSRYTIFSIPAVIGIYVILIKSTLDRRSYAVAGLSGALVLLVLISLPVSYAEGIRAGRMFEINRQKEAFLVSTYESQPSELLKKIPWVRRGTERIVMLKKLGYSVFSEREQGRVLPPGLSTLSPVPGRTLFGVQNIADVEVRPQDQPVVVPKRKPFIKVTGWAVDDRAKDVAGGVYVDIDGKLLPAFYGARKNGIARRFDVPAYEYSGFERAIPTSEIGAGTHTLSVVVLTADRKGYYQPGREVIFEVR